MKKYSSVIYKLIVLFKFAGGYCPAQKSHGTKKGRNQDIVAGTYEDRKTKRVSVNV